MKTTAMRASPVVPQQKERSLPGGRDANVTPDVTESPKPRLRLVPPVPVKVVRTPFVILVIVVVVAGVLGILVLNTKINQNAFEIAALRDEQTKLDLRQQQLERQIADYESPGNLAAAGRKLGLVDPGAPAFITLPDGKVIGVPKPASGTPSAASQ